MQTRRFARVPPPLSRNIEAALATIVYGKIKNWLDPAHHIAHERQRFFYLHFLDVRSHRASQPLD